MRTYKNIAKELEDLCIKRKKENEKLKLEIDKKEAVLQQMADIIYKIEKEIDELKKSEKTSISENAPNYEALYKKLQDQHQSDCITINQLHVTIDTLCDKYSRLRKIHGL